jgi:hypothetical protein
VHDLKPGDVVILKEVNTAPADGVVITGDAWIRENLFTGSLKPAKKTEGSEIYASTQVTGGRVHFRVGDDEPRADRLLELYTSAFARPKTDSQATRIAELLAGPILLLGLAALGRGGIHMTKAVIRPDYFSGPAMAEDFGDFGMILKAADAGIVILDPNVLVPIFKADYWVFDDTDAWRLTRASKELLDSLDQNHDRQIVFLSKRGSQRIVERDGGLRFSRLDTGASTAAKKAFIAQRQAYGQSVVYFGDCQRERVLTEAADVSVMVADKHHRVNAEAPIVFLSPDVEKFSSLHRYAKSAMQRSKALWQWLRYQTWRQSVRPWF